MMIDPHVWLRWTKPFLSSDRADWLQAMESELAHIEDDRARHNFAFGCFASIVQDFSRSRRGLSSIARCAGAFSILTMSCFGIWSAMRMNLSTEASMVPYMIIALCMFYMGAAGFLLTSLSHLRTYAKIGAKLAIAGWVYGLLASSMSSPIPSSFMQAISIEMAGFMIGLYALTIWLGWLYTPGACDEC